MALLTGLSGTMTIMTTTAERAAERATAHAAELSAELSTGLTTGPAASSVTSASDIWLRQAELAMLVCFATVATVNTLVALTVDRRREFALLRLAGATRHRLLAVLGVEAVLTAAVGVLLGAGVAAAASAAFSTAVTGTMAPAVPAAACGWIAGGALVLTLPGILVPALWATTGPAAALVAGAGVTDRHLPGAAGAAAPAAGRPYFSVRGGELLFAVAGLPPALVGGLYALAVLYAGTLLSLTVLGLPFVALGLTAARGLGGCTAG
ncbi:FtsX-like permease family protein [Kitasatospora aburaviensis]